jgi:hypothetical protein
MAETLQSKPWWQSKTTISGIITALIGLYAVLVPIFALPPIPEWLLSILTALGVLTVYGRTTATKVIQ